MVMRNSRVGQVRIIEAVVASVMLFIIFTTAFFMLFSSEKFFEQETVDLNRLAYNVLNRLVESGVIEEAVSDGRVDGVKIASTLQSMLPQNIYFNLTISERTTSGSWRTTTSISNAPRDLFEKSLEVASAGIIYTTKDGRMYYLSLSLTRAGLASML